jgi:hypothetical protein
MMFFRISVGGFIGQTPAAKINRQYPLTTDERSHNYIPTTTVGSQSMHA